MKLSDTAFFNKNRIAIVLDDHLLFADSFSAVLERLQFFNTVHTFNEGKDLIRFLMQYDLGDIFLFADYYLKCNNSSFIIKEAKRINKNINIIIISSVVNPVTIKSLLTYHPKGFVSKSSGTDIVIDCIKHIGKGESYICPVIREILNSSDTIKEIPFTARELDILNYFAKGLSIAETAERAFLSKHTIVAHRRKMMEKTKTHSITELLAYCRQAEII